jgi:Ser/Thr protein kinase RdoA (MazF antagonist)
MPGGAAVLRRLLDAGLVSAAEVVDGEVSLRDVSRSNSVYLVTAGDRPPVVAKACLADRPVGQGDPALERAFYRALAANGVGPADLPVPALVAAGEDLLVLGALDGAETVERRIRAGGPAGTVACLFGTALARWRRMADRIDWSAMPLRGAEPWALTVATPDEPAFVADYPALRRMAREVADRPGLRRRLGELRAGWCRRGVVHGDVRWDNALLVPGGRDRIVLVDWEFVDLGDPAWDIAGAVADSLIYAVLPLDHGNGDGLLAPEGLGRLCASLDWFLASFGSAYAAVAGSDDLAAASALVPARLVQNAFQLAAHEGESGFESGVALLGLAASLAEAPDILGRWLAGLPVGVSAPTGHRPP